MTKLTPKQLESHLWESANTLCGSINSSAYKNYIFGIVFLKGLSDVFEDEFARAVEREMAKGSNRTQAKAIAKDRGTSTSFLRRHAHAFLSAPDDTIRGLEAEAVTLREVKRGLIQDLLSGKGRV